jgi:hypothetical protein
MLLRLLLAPVGFAAQTIGTSASSEVPQSRFYELLCDDCGLAKRQPPVTSALEVAQHELA